jgi:hypothetical protein
MLEVCRVGRRWLALTFHTPRSLRGYVWTSTKGQHTTDVPHALMIQRTPGLRVVTPTCLLRGVPREEGARIPGGNQSENMIEVRDVPEVER